MSENILENFLSESEISAIVTTISRSSIYEERLAAAGRAKEEAAVELEKKFPGQAIPHYLNALYHLDFSETQTFQFIPKHMSEISSLQAKILSNLSLCYFQVRNFHLSRRAADLALPSAKFSDELTAKIFFRRALVFKEIGDISRSKADAEEALKKIPGDAKIIELVKEMREQDIEIRKTSDADFRGKLIAEKTKAPESSWWWCCKRRKVD